DGLLRWGNVAVGKLIEALWWGSEPRFTDVGCTYRAIWRDAYRKIRDYLICDDAAFSPEMMIEMLRVEGRVIEIPVSYYRRRGGGRVSLPRRRRRRRHGVGPGNRIARSLSVPTRDRVSGRSGQRTAAARASAPATRSSSASVSAPHCSQVRRAAHASASRSMRARSPASVSRRTSCSARAGTSPYG